MAVLLGPKGSFTVQAGVFRHVVTLQKPTVTSDSVGGQQRSWRTVWDEVPASIVYLSGKELIAAQQIQSSVTAAISIRWRPGIDATLRVLHQRNAPDSGTDTFNVESFQPDESGRKTITLMCSQRAADGIRSDT